MIKTSQEKGQFKLQNRAQLSEEYKWNVEALFENLNTWNKEFEGFIQSKPWEKIEKFQGRLHEGPLVILECLQNYFLTERLLSKFYTYAHLRHDEDVAEEGAKIAHEKALKAFFTFEEITAWLRPEILAQENRYLEACLKEQSLSDYRVFLERLFRLKPHTLSKKEETILSFSSPCMLSPRKIFTSLTNADLKFKPALDSHGNLFEVTLASYGLLIKSADRTLRKNAFESLHGGFLSFENTFAELLYAQVQTHYFEARAKNYRSCLEASLFPHQIDIHVYENLIRVVNQHLPSLHKYIRLRKNKLGLDKLQPYDLYTSLVPAIDISISYEEAQNKVLDAALFLGEGYRSKLKKGLLEDRWVDRYPNLRKRSGAYSSGCYDSMPYILLNYQGTLSDAMTFCHEAGHSMHTLYSKTHQPSHYASYPIFVAEVASTFQEEVLLRSLLQSSSGSNKTYLLHQKIEDIRTTFFRQTLFAEFELLIHQWVERGHALTPSFLKEEYRKLNHKYYGEDLEPNEYLNIEWARIPHFYSNFYVYQYATGISAAIALVNLIEKKGESAKKAYLEFLSSGSSRSSLELLEIAGVNMKKEDALVSIIEYFNALVDQLDSCLLAEKTCKE